MMKPELSESEIKDVAMEQDLVIAYRTVYAARFCKNCGARLEKVYYYRGEAPLTKKGRFHIVSVEHANKLLGFDMFRRLD